MPRKPRILECPQCGGRITAQTQYSCRTCGYVLDMARISHQSAVRHDHYEAWRRKLEFVHVGLWALVTLGVVSMVAIKPGAIMFAAGIVAGFVQVFWGKLILARLKRR